MKKFRKWICVALALLLLCLAGCGQQDEWAKSLEAIERIGGITDDALLREDTEKMLNALLLDPVREIVARECYARHTNQVPDILRAEMGNDAGIIGAALLGRAI